ncbi:myosin-2 heavy chain, non muscle-like [Pipra filicauda]|uniref:Myosin-2 heavy chain, non muscle-like n=1 Tax=Pipra filicauda TaxID=649802 RepID=A0A6J2HGY3_9PASS|nr:myosin-2 heavy chain, non muscle-like [Pipra filicauda]
MEISRPHPPPPARRPWKAVAAAALGVAVVVVAVTVPTVLCRSAGGCAGAGGASEGLARLEEELDVTNRSLVEAREQRDGCREELGVLEGKASELKQALAEVTRLEEENKELRTEVSRQQEQLEQEQSRREELQQQNQALQEQLQDTRSQQTSGNGDKPSGLLPFLFFLLLLGLLLRK